MPPLKLRCAIPASMGAKLAQEVQATSGRGARLKDPEMQASLERNLVRDQDMLPHKVKSWFQGVQEKFNFAEKSVRSFRELGDTNGENDLRLMYKQFTTSTNNAMSVAATVTADAFKAIHESPVDGFVKLRESYQLLFVKSNWERAKRGNETVFGKDAKYWEGEYTHLRSTSMPEALETERKVFSLMREIGKDLEEKGQLPKGTVDKNGDYVPHDVLQFLENDLRVTQSKSFRLKLAGHAKRAFGSQKELYSDYHTSIQHYVASMERSKATSEFLGKLVARFGDDKAAELVRKEIKNADGDVIGHTNVVTGVKNPETHGMWRFNNTTWGAQRMQRALGLEQKASFIKSQRELTPDLTDTQIEAHWHETLNLMEGGGKTVVLPKGLVDDLVEWEKGSRNAGEMETLRTLNAFWRRNMTGRIGLYTGIFTNRNSRGDWQQTLRDEPKALSIANDVAIRLFGQHKGVTKYAVQWQTKLTNLASKAVRDKIPGSKTLSYTDEEFAAYRAEADKNGVTVGKFLGEATTPSYSGKNSAMDLYANAGNSKATKLLAKANNKFDEIDSLIKTQDATYRLSKYIVDRMPVERGGKGLSEAQATRANGDTFVDYQLLTPFEKTWMRDGLFPFYTFRKGNTVQWAKRLFDKRIPANERAQAWATVLAFSAVPVLWNHLMDPEGEEKLQNDPRNKYLANTFHLFMGRDDEGNAYYFTDPLPSSDVDRIFNVQQLANKAKVFAKGDRPLSQAPEEIASQLLGTILQNTAGIITDESSPVVKMGFELHANKSFYYKIPIRKTDAPSYVQAAQVGNYLLKTFDRQFATAQGLYFNKASPAVDALRLIGTPINVHRAALSKSNVQEVEGELFGGVIHPQVPKKDKFIEQYERLMKDELTPDEREVLLDNYPTIKDIMAKEYSTLVNERIRSRQDLIKKALVANGFTPEYSMIFKLPDEQREAITEKVKSQTWFRKLTSFTDKDRRQIYQRAMEEAGIR